MVGTRKFTRKQRKWLSIYLDTNNATEAAMQSYNCSSRDVAKRIGWENTTRLDFQELLDLNDLTDQTLIRKVKSKMEARNPRFINGKVVAVEDHQAQLKAIEMALKLKNRLVDKVDVSGEVNAKITVEVNTNQGYIARLVEADVTPATGYAGESTKIQSSGVASKGEEDNNSNPRTS